MNNLKNLTGWYDRVYLCYEDTNFNRPKTYSPIRGFDCYRYNSFESANAGWKNKTDLCGLDLRHTMIPICRWVPKMFDKYILNWKLKTIYWGGEISIYRDYKKFE